MSDACHLCPIGACERPDCPYALSDTAHEDELGAAHEPEDCE